MVSQREKQIYYSFIVLVALGMLVFVGICYGIMVWLRSGFDASPFSYARFAVIAMVSLLIEGVTRNDEWRATPGRGAHRLHWYVTQRQWLWLSVSLGISLFFVRDMHISRIYLSLIIGSALPLFYAANRWGYGAFLNALARRGSRWRLRYALIGSDDWRQSVRSSMNGLGQILEQGEEYQITSHSSLDELSAWVQSQPMDLLVMPTRQIPDNWVTHLLALGERRGFRCWIPLELSRMHGRQFNLQRVGGLNVLTPPGTPLGHVFNRLVKRTFDIAFSLAVITFILPTLMVIVWCLHRRYAPGPLFFMQERLGENGKVFRVIKFRTMHLHNENEARQASQGDPRIFKFGQLLRKFSVDEFPQFVNVLRGEMSVVGPRPHLEAHERRFEEFYERYGMRRFVKPGVTGLAQVRGFRGEVKTAQDIRGRGRYDLIYVKNWSFGLDIKIVLETATQLVLPPRSAY